MVPGEIKTMEGDNDAQVAGIRNQNAPVERSSMNSICHETEVLDGSISQEHPGAAQLTVVHGSMVSSTPIAGTGHHARPSTLANLSPCIASSGLEDSLQGDSVDLTTSLNMQAPTEPESQETLQAPIVGYEIMEQRAKFTIFRIQVLKCAHESWFLFRRYSDFVRLNSKLKDLFPNFRLSLPPKRWFGNNFDRNFLEDRLLGLQAFVNNILGHGDLSLSEPVREFFCLDDPPGPHDSLEESRALCESLEDDNYKLKQEVLDREEKIALLEEEVLLYKAEVENLKKALRLERSTNRHCSPSSQPSECSLPEHEQLAPELRRSSELSMSGNAANSCKMPQEDLSGYGLSTQSIGCDTRAKELTSIGDGTTQLSATGPLHIRESQLQPVDLLS